MFPLFEQMQPSELVVAGPRGAVLTSDKSLTTAGRRSRQPHRGLVVRLPRGAPPPSLPSQREPLRRG